MDLDQLKLILNLVREHELSEFEIEHEGLRLKVRKDPATLAAPPPASGVSMPTLVAAAPALPGVPLPGSTGQGPGAGAAEADVELAVVKSPIVGTFYSSAEPGAPAFVEVGSVVKKGQVLCIIEAMKLMNEIDSEYEGEIVNIYVENAQPVQYGERLFALRVK